MKRSSLIACLLFVLAFVLSFSPISPVRAAAPAWQPALPYTPWPGGTINTHVTWTKANSPYVLSGRVEIAAGGLLTIEPGVTVQSPENSGGLFIQSGGQVSALGSTTDPIYFTAVDLTKPWDSIIVNTGGILRLDNCDIAYAKNTYSTAEGALYLIGADVQVSNTRIHNNTGNGIYLQQPAITPQFENVTIDHNTGVPIYQFFLSAQPVYHNIIMHDNTGGDFLVINNADVSQPLVLDGSGLNGKPVVVNANINLYNTLTVVPGTEIRMYPTRGIFIQNGGKLVAEGSSSTNTIRFTAVDTANPWNMIMVNIGGALRMNFCDIAYANSNGSSGSGILFLWGTDVQVRNTRFHDNNSGAVYLNQPDITPLFDTVTIDHNTGIALFQFYLSAQPVFHNIIMHDNTGGDYLVINNADVSQPTVLDATGLNGKPVIVNSNFNLYNTLTIVPGAEIRMYPSNGIFVQSGGKLVAEGTAANPIRFTAVNPANPWNIIMVNTGGSLRLDHCEVDHANSNGSSGVGVFYLTTSDVEVRNCRIHDNAAGAIEVVYDSHPLFRENQIYNNTYGLLNMNSLVWVDARFNYWGDPTGPFHPTSNPAGLGQGVSDKVAFAPWYEDTQGTLTSKVLVQVLGPTRAASGQTLEYQVLYFSGGALTDAVLTFSLPDTANFISTTPDGAYYPKTGQVYWKLGNLPAKAEGTRTVTVQAMWGLPNNYPDAVAVMMGSPSLSLAPYTIDTTALKAYTPITATASTVLTSGQIDSALAASTKLKALYDSAVSQGYKRVGGAVLSTSDGKSTTQISLISAAKGLVNLRLDQSSGSAEAITFKANTFTMTNQDGSVTLDLAQNQVLPTGSWNTTTFAPPPLVQPLVQPLLTTAAEISPYVCWRNCMLQAAGMWAIQKLNNTLDAVLKTKDCAMALTGDPDAAANCFLGLQKVTKLVPGVSEIKETTKCTAECANPLKRGNYVCNGSLTSVEPPTWAWANPASWTEAGGKRQYVRYNCNSTTQMWCAPEILYCAPGFVAQAGAKDTDGRPCVPANDDVAFAYGYPDRKVPSSRSKLAMRTAKDPNAKYGVNGSAQSAVLPGQVLTYTITYENVGAGEAYGVYILDTLSAQLDETTLNLHGSGRYYPASRQVAWDIGELAPKGEAGSSGSVTFNITPKAGLPMGAEIVNQALVYFPSVPEETPTNAVINTLQPAVAVPQELQATAGLAKPIALQGAGPGNLTYQVVDTPMHGSLTGAAPHLNYTADPAFSGTDIFSFRVQGSAGASLAAQVILTVVPNPSETIPPAVVWISPANSSILASPNPPTFTDAGGTGYFPQIVLQFSEALDPATVIPANVTLTAGSSPLIASLAFLPGLNQVLILPRQELPLDTPITLTISTAVKDTQGNSLAALYTATFKLTAPTNGYTIFLPLIKKK
jgi:uncharacterized repeat protein (TIGR01451 family)